MTTTRRMRWSLSVVLCVFAVLAGGVKQAVAAGRLNDREVRIGAILPMTGNFAEWGKAHAVVLKMIEDEVNAAGGVEGGKLKITFYDDSSKPAQAGNLMNKLASDDKVLAVVGPLSSGNCEVAFPIANELKIVSTSMASSKAGVAKANRPYAFRNTIDEVVLAKATAAYFKKAYDIKTVAIIYDAKEAVSTALGTKVFPAIMEANGIKVLNAASHISFQTYDLDVSAQVTALKALNPDGVIIAADGSQAVTVLREMKRQGFTKPVLGGSPIIITATLRAAPEIPVVAPATFYPGIKPAAAAKFESKLTPLLRKSGSLRPDVDATMYDANVYEIVHMYIDAIKNAGVTTKPEDLASDREKIMKYLTSLKGFQGLGGPISFNADGDAIKTFYVVVGQNGKWTEKARGCSGPTGSC